MENYKINFGKYENKSIHVMVKDKSYCKWFLKNVKNRDELKDYIINYKKYCKLIEDDKRNKQIQIKNKMNGFNLLQLPNEILRKIFLMSNSQFYTDLVIKINLKYENRLNKSLHDGFCKCCGTFDVKNGFQYCYSCNMEIPRKTRDKLTNKRREKTIEYNQNQKLQELNDFPLKYFERCVIPSLKKVETDCKKTISQVKNATLNIYLKSKN